jgi:hypothetical protein
MRVSRQIFWDCGQGSGEGEGHPTIQAAHFMCTFLQECICMLEHVRSPREARCVGRDSTEGQWDGRTAQRRLDTASGTRTSRANCGHRLIFKVDFLRAGSFPDVCTRGSFRFSNGSILKGIGKVCFSGNRLGKLALSSSVQRNKTNDFVWVLLNKAELSIVVCFLNRVSFLFREESRNEG